MLIDQSRGAILVLFDNSAVFDMLDHDFLLQYLVSDMGITDLALNSYLGDRYQRVICNSVLSNPILVRYGVPQGPVLGPKAFIMVTCIVECTADNV